MIAKELQDWFPEAQISDQADKKNQVISLPYSSGSYWRKLAQRA